MAFKSNMLFDVLNNILASKSIEMFNSHVQSENFKDASKYMVLKYLTMSTSENVRDVVISNYLTLERMPEVQLYRWLMNNIPQQRSGFIKYIK